MNFAEMMPQSLTYWPPGSPDGYGQVAFGSPVLVACRWQEDQKLFRDANGQEVMSEAVVYSETELALHGYVALGDQTSQADPRVLAEAREVRQVGASRSLDASEVLRKAWL